MIKSQTLSFAVLALLGHVSFNDVVSSHRLSKGVISADDFEHTGEHNLEGAVTSPDSQYSQFLKSYNQYDGLMHEQNGVLRRPDGSLVQGYPYEDQAVDAQGEGYDVKAAQRNQKQMDSEVVDDIKAKSADEDKAKARNPYTGLIHDAAAGTRQSADGKQVTGANDLTLSQNRLRDSALTEEIKAKADSEEGAKATTKAQNPYTGLIHDAAAGTRKSADGKPVTGANDLTLSQNRLRDDALTEEIKAKAAADEGAKVEQKKKDLRNPYSGLIHDHAAGTRSSVDGVKVEGANDLSLHQNRVRGDDPRNPYSGLVHDHKAGTRDFSDGGKVSGANDLTLSQGDDPRNPYSGLVHDHKAGTRDFSDGGKVSGANDLTLSQGDDPRNPYSGLVHDHKAGTSDFSDGGRVDGANNLTLSQRMKRGDDPRNPYSGLVHDHKAGTRDFADGGRVDGANDLTLSQHRQMARGAEDDEDPIQAAKFKASVEKNIKDAELERRKKRQWVDGLVHNDDGSREFFPWGPAVGGANNYRQKKHRSWEGEIDNVEANPNQPLSTVHHQGGVLETFPHKPLEGALETPVSTPITSSPYEPVTLHKKGKHHHKKHHYHHNAQHHSHGKEVDNVEANPNQPLSTVHHQGGVLETFPHKPLEGALETPVSTPITSSPYEPVNLLKDGKHHHHAHHAQSTQKSGDDADNKPTSVHDAVNKVTITTYPSGTQWYKPTGSSVNPLDMGTQNSPASNNPLTDGYWEGKNLSGYKSLAHHHQHEAHHHKHHGHHHGHHHHEHKSHGHHQKGSEVSSVDKVGEGVDHVGEGVDKAGEGVDNAGQENVAVHFGQKMSEKEAKKETKAEVKTEAKKETKESEKNEEVKKTEKKEKK